jgi:hypothetical protein
MAMDRAEASTAATNRALELYRDLAAEFPRVPEYHSQTAALLSQRAMVCNDQREALADWEAAIDLQRKALASVPDHAVYRERLASHLVNRLWSFRQLGRHRDISAHADEVVALMPSSAPHLQHAGALLLLGAALVVDDDTLADDEREPLYEAMVQRGVAHLRGAVAAGCRDYKRFSRQQFAGVLDHPAVVAVVQEMRALAEAEAAAPPGENPAENRTGAGGAIGQRKQ